ncbi:carboxymuconolactone decarboxylase family protein [Thiobacillus sedimenti]|uniref:Carboxymuconolactone decarboxylase family protein n=1 Tax=Thiobacillus sedimenti TaxID=3110231 RepID=A0ABZ1CK96_9PROT|nr:carboxymuconolactone decarboxylase family protein [Thiobacillus sp. SCUT-2]WRS39809.1 carboxymuconolactone decarboxylase family protein [Thiobacillus sp. SCUT-2]
MSILQTVTPEAATDEVAEIYAQIRNAWGHVPTAIQVFSANPFLLRHQWEYYGSIMQHPRLSLPLTASIRMLVSQAGQCDYCIDMNAGMLINAAGWTPEQVAATRADYHASPLTAAEKVLLGLVLKMTRDSGSVTHADLQAARDAGWSDADILDAVNHGARMVAGDIVINGFKVERDF